MTKLIGVSFLCSALICSMPGVASAQFYPPVRDPNATYRLPGTDDYYSGRGVFNPVPNPAEHRSIAPAKTKKPHHPAGAQMQHLSAGTPSGEMENHAGAEKVFWEKTASGARTDRAQLRHVIGQLEKGDVLTVIASWRDQPATC